MSQNPSITATSPPSPVIIWLAMVMPIRLIGFRRAQIVKYQLDTVTPIPIALAAQLIAIQDIITTAKTVHLPQSEVVMLQSRL